MLFAQSRHYCECWINILKILFIRKNKSGVPYLKREVFANGMLVQEYRWYCDEERNNSYNITNEFNNLISWLYMV